MYLILALALSYIFYRRGIRFLFKSKLIISSTASLLAYIFLMLSGVIMAEYMSLTFIPVFISINNWNLILATTIFSIFSGELIYYRNNKLVKRIVMNDKNRTN